MTFQVSVHIPEDLSLPKTEAIRDEQSTIMETDGCVSGQSGCVSKPHMKKVVQKVAQILATQGGRAANVPVPNISYIPYPTAKKLI